MAARLKVIRESALTHCCSVIEKEGKDGIKRPHLDLGVSYMYRIDEN